MTETVLVTGGCGFIGRHLVQDLLDQGYGVRILDSLVEQVHAGMPPHPPADVDFVQADVCDPDAVRSALQGVDMVVHLAAEVGVGQSMYEIARYVGANDLGTAVLLEQITRDPVRRLIVASSMSVYGEGRYKSSDGNLRGNVGRDRDRIQAALWEPVDDAGNDLEPVPTDEAKPVDLASIYALTKYGQERAVLIFALAYGIDAVALRLFNVFGAGQALSNPYTGVLANFASRLINGERPMIFEDGLQKRDFVHVRDVARAFRIALEEPRAAGHVINIGSGRAYTIATVAQLLAKAMGQEHLEPQILNKHRAGDIRHCFADISCARDLLAYEPEHLLENSLDEFVEWVGRTTAVDHGAEMRRQLEERGLVS
jgi:dTDP-L-rhamnose 4-epimerase